MRNIVFIWLIALAATASVAAQTRHDSTAPIDIDADHGQLQDRANRASLSGNVRIRQAEMTLNAARVEVTYTGQVSGGSPEVSRLVASGGVTLTRPGQSARGKYGVYDINRHVVIMIGDVTLRQGANMISGQRLTINLDTGQATINGSGKGVAATSSQPGDQNRSGRVTGRFSVPRRDGPAATPTATPQQ